MPTVPIVPQTTAPAPFAVVELETLEAELLVAYAEWDGTGASGDFLACLAIYSDAGVRLGRVFPNATVTAGESAVVTYAPFPGGIAPPEPVQGLPLWTDITDGLSLSNGTLGGGGGGRNAAMVQDISTEFSSIFTILYLELATPGDNTAEYQVLGIPGYPWDGGSDFAPLLQGYSVLSPGTGGTLPFTPSYISASGAVVFPGGVQPAFQAGDILFAGFGVYPNIPE